ncbi:MAG: GntR family transcriptional regulator, partial [Clostridia bacterium]|nr:GntR family transcriptional regulator [Clostridia bacterium]
MAGKDVFTTSCSLTDEIHEIVRDRILKGEYKIGQKIKETQIAEELKVSRTPIREAFKQLENEGLIDYIPNRGCFAKGFTSQDIEDLYAVRKALEILSVEWAVERIDEDQLKQLKEKSDLM